MNNNAIVGGLYNSVFEFLQPDINRPDLFEQRTTSRSGIYKGNIHKHNKVKIISTLVLIIISAFIFISIVGWASVLQSFIDSIYIDNSIRTLTLSRTIYSTIITLITFVFVTIILYLYFSKKHLFISH